MRLIALYLWITIAASRTASANRDEFRQRFAAIPLATNGLIPRYFVDPALPLAKRVAGCEAGSHSCLDIGSPDLCCRDDDYCYVTDDLRPACCPIGINCANSECSSDSYVCTQTVTEATDVEPTATATCCARICPATSQYLCAENLGGACCSYGYECRAEGNCVSTLSEATTSNAPLLTPIPSGCTTSQFSCTGGLGCCDNGKACTEVNGTEYCAIGLPTGPGMTLIPGDELDDSGSDLSDGEKAGIAIGAIVGAGGIIGIFTWLCLGRRRRQRQQSASQQSGPPQSGLRLEATDMRRGTDPAMTELSGSVRPRPGRGLTQDYFGPAAVVGPYTETAPSQTTSPGFGHDRAVPTQPQEPGDITAAVEMDSTKGGPLMTPRSMSQASGDTGLVEVPAHESIQGRFELHGSNGPSPQGLPSPLASPTLGQYERPPSRTR